MTLLLLLLGCTGHKSVDDSTSPPDSSPGDSAPAVDTSAPPQPVVESRTEGWMLLINEFYVNDSDGGNGDWIELYNAGEDEADMAGVVVQTSAGEDDNLQLSSYTDLEPGQFLLLESGCADTAGPCLDFSLKREGETIGVCDSECIGGARDVLTYEQYSAETDGQSYARSTDGGTDWIYDEPTPGGSNAP